jgi:hypothetical protein
MEIVSTYKGTHVRLTAEEIKNAAANHDRLLVVPKPKEEHKK